MTRILLAHEWKSRRAIVVLGLIVWVLLVGLALASGVSRAREHEQGAERYLAVDAAQFAGYERRADAIERVRRGDPAPDGVVLHKNEFDWGPTQPMYVAAWLPMKVVVPPGPREALAIGDSEIRTQAFEIPIWERAPRPIVEPSVSALSAAAWKLDLTFVVLYLLPLLAVAISFDIVARDRDEGVLPLVLAQPVSFRRWLLTKMAFGVGVVSVAVFVAAGAVFIALGARHDQVWPTAMWAIAAGLYGSIWLSLAALVNMRRQTAVGAAIALTAIWLMLVVIVPTLSQAAATASAPTPSRASYAEAQRALSVGAERRFDDATDGEREKVIGAFFHRHPELSGEMPKSDTIGYYYLSRFAWYETIQADQAWLDAQFEAPLAQQERLAAAAGWLSPASLMYRFSTSLAGTDRERYRDVLAQAQRYEAEYKRFLWPRMIGNRTMSARELARTPRFRYVETPWPMTARRVMIPLAGLLVWAVTISALAYARASRSWSSQ